MAGGFEALGLGEELVQAVQEDLGWLLPTDVQDEAIPLILGGGDVMAAAETGSGKTAAYALPVLQLVMETKKRQAAGKDQSATLARAATSLDDWRMSGDDRDPMLGIDEDGSIACATAPRWIGGRATIGVQSGQAYYEASMQDSGLGRFGWSTGSANFNLGTDRSGVGFGGTGMKSMAGNFEKYGQSFGHGDVIGCYIDLDRGRVSFSKNGEYFGEAFTLLTQGQPHFPALVLKQGKARVNFRGPFAYPPKLPYVGVGSLAQERLHLPSFKRPASSRPMGGDSSQKKCPLALIIEPARDLAEQVYNCVNDYSRYMDDVGAALVVGGVAMGELKAGMRKGSDILVGTTGKMVDLIEQGAILLDNVRFFILDEADRLLETGNRDDIMKIFQRLPKGGAGDQRLQVSFFSATLHSPEITELADQICDNPTWVDLKGKDSVPESVHHVVVDLDPEAAEYQQLLGQPESRMLSTDNVHPHLPHDGKERGSELIKMLKPLVLKRLIDVHNMEQCLVFCRTNLDCDLLEQFLVKLGGGRKFIGKVEKGKENVYSCCVLAGMRSMQERRANLQAFKDGDVRFLICTDVAARGIDIQGLPFVINMTLPDVVENYIHRVGRVGRADCIGLAISLVAASGLEEKVWFHTCPNRGKACTNRSFNNQGGCTRWYGEPEILQQVEARLHMDKIPRMKPPSYELPPELKKSLGSAQYGQAAGNSNISEVVAKHVELLKPAVSELIELEFKAQSSYLRLRQWHKN